MYILNIHKSHRHFKIELNSFASLTTVLLIGGPITNSTKSSLTWHTRVLTWHQSVIIMWSGGGGAHLGEGVGAAHGAVRDVGARVRGALQVSQVTAQAAATLPEPVCGNKERRG